MKTQKLILDDFQEEKIASSKMKKIFGGITQDMVNQQNQVPVEPLEPIIPPLNTGTGTGVTNGSGRP